MFSSIFLRLYERAIAAAGTDFRSDKLWDSYINWEKSKDHLRAVTCLYDRLLKVPTQLYSHHFERYLYLVICYEDHFYNYGIYSQIC